MARLRPREFLVANRTGGAIGLFAVPNTFKYQIGKTGNGPGEQRIVRRIRVGRGDTIYVLDSLEGRVNIFNSSGRFISMIRVPRGVFDFWAVGARRVIVAGAVRSRGSAGYPLHIVEQDGRLTSFGGDGSLLGPGRERQLLRLFSRKGNDEIWAAHQKSYTIEGWKGTTRTAILKRDVSWFPEWDGIESPASARRPTAQIRGINEDDAGLLWVFTTVADQNWRPIPLRDAPTPGEKVSSREDYDRLYDTIIEVIDPRHGSMIVHARSNRKLTPIGDGYVYSYEVGTDGAPVYRLWRARLIRSTQGAGSS